MNVIEYVQTNELVMGNIWSNQKIILSLELFGFDRQLQSSKVDSLSEDMKIQLEHVIYMLTDTSIFEIIN